MKAKLTLHGRFLRAVLAQLPFEVPELPNWLWYVFCVPRDLGLFGCYVCFEEH